MCHATDSVTRESCTDLLIPLPEDLLCQAGMVVWPVVTTSLHTGDGTSGNPLQTRQQQHGTPIQTTCELSIAANFTTKYTPIVLVAKLTHQYASASHSTTHQPGGRQILHCQHSTPPQHPHRHNNAVCQSGLPAKVCFQL